MKSKSFILKKRYILISFVFIIFIICFLFTIYFNNNKIKKIIKDDTIYPNIYIENINVSGFSKEEGVNYLKTNYKKEENFILLYGDDEIVYKKEDLGLEYDFEKAIDIAYNTARNNSEQIKNLLKNPIKISLNHKLNEEKLNQEIENLEQKLNKDAKDPTLIKEGESFTVVPGSEGLKIDSEKLKQDIIESLDEKGDIYLEIQFEKIAPKDEESLKMVQDKLGTFSTSYAINSEEDENRITNMKVAASKINTVVLYPEEVFSANAFFGETTEENGYKLAKVIKNGEFIDEYGGGVCQVSTTLYNAALYAELDILERKNHSLKVLYADYGYDAALASDYIDLKFKNNTNYPIYIESYLTENQVICNIYGYDERAENREIKFQNELVEVIPPGDRIENTTEDLKQGEEVIEVKALNGYRYNLYKLIYEDGVLVDKVLINESYYKPRQEEVLVGIN